MLKQPAVRVMPYAWVILVVVYLASVVAPFNQFKIPPIMPVLMQAFKIGAIPTATFAAAPEIMRKPQWAGLGLALVLTGQYLGQLVGPVLFGQLANGLGDGRLFNDPDLPARVCLRLDG